MENLYVSDDVVMLKKELLTNFNAHLFIDTSGSTEGQI